MENKRFVNPYNFIHFPKEKAHKYDDSDKHTGVIEYTLTTKSPLFIPNSSNDNFFNIKVDGHKSYDFYSYTDISNSEDTNYHEPVIPGSEMRGLIRSTYETLTDSCMGLLNDVHPIKRVGAMFNPGLLAWNGNQLDIVDAFSLRIDSKRCGNHLDGSRVYFNWPAEIKCDVYDKVSDCSFDPSNRYQDGGYLIRWGFGVKKRNNYHIFVDNGEDPIKSNLDINDVRRSVNDVIDSYLENPQSDGSQDKAYEAYRNAFNKFIDEKTDDCFPINYALVEDEKLYLSPTTYSKEISNSSLYDLTKLTPCKDEVCPTCDLFGRVGDNAKGSLVRFSDLRVINKVNDEDYYQCNSVTLKPLNGPKLGNVDFYLERPNGASYWSYDYIVKNGEIVLEKGILRGRKYYWHFPNDVVLKNDEPSNLNKTIRPVKKNVSFKGQLYFDGISYKQLKQLIYILNMGKDNRGLKLGTGKPFGLGSVSLRVNNVKIRKISYKNDEVSYKEGAYDFSNINYDNAGLSKEVKDEFLKITKLDVVPKNLEVCYPKTSASNDKGFEWFIANHAKDGRIRMINDRTDMVIRYALPHILDSDISLIRLDRAQANSSFKKR